MIKKIENRQDREDNAWARLKGLDLEEIRKVRQENHHACIDRTKWWPHHFRLHAPDIEEYRDVVGDGSPKQEAVRHNPEDWVNG